MSQGYTQADIQTAAEKIHAEIAQHDEPDCSVDTIATKISNFLEYDVPFEESVNQVRKTVASASGVQLGSRGGFSGSAESIDIIDIDTGGQSITLDQVKVVQLWSSTYVDEYENGDGKIETVDSPETDSDPRQVGLLGDETDTIKFVVFEEDVPALEPGETYQIENALTDYYEPADRCSITLNDYTSITEIGENVDVGDGSETRTGTLVDIQSGSGLIQRCPKDDCSRLLDASGYCQEHGKVDGKVLDTRIKAIIDDGRDYFTAIFDSELMEELTGISLNDAKEIQQENITDDSPVVDVMSRPDGGVLGLPLTVTGSEFSRNFIVNGYEVGYEVPSFDELTQRAEVQA